MQLNPELLKTYHLSDDDIRARFRKGHKEFIPEHELMSFVLYEYGYTDEQIATIIDYAPSSIHTYRRDVRDKLGLTNIPEAHFRALVRLKILPVLESIIESKHAYLRGRQLETFVVTNPETGRTLRLWKPPQVDEMDSVIASQFIRLLVMTFVLIVIGAMVFLIFLIASSLSIAPYPST